MSNRETEANEVGAIKLYLLPDEIAFIVNCLSWLQSELEVTSAKLSALNALSNEYNLGEDSKRSIDLVLPIFEKTATRLMSECSEHFKETKERKGYAKVQEMQNGWSDKFDRLKKLKNVVNSSIESEMLSAFLTKLENS